MTDQEHDQRYVTLGEVNRNVLALRDELRAYKRDHKREHDEHDEHHATTLRWAIGAILSLLGVGATVTIALASAS